MTSRDEILVHFSMQGLFVPFAPVGSVTQQIHWIQLKQLLLRHMYNLLLPNLCATLLVASTQLLYCGHSVDEPRMSAILYCTVA